MEGEGPSRTLHKRLRESSTLEIRGLSSTGGTDQLPRPRVRFATLSNEQRVQLLLRSGLCAGGERLAIQGAASIVSKVRRIYPLWTLANRQPLWSKALAESVILLG